MSTHNPDNLKQHMRNNGFSSFKHHIKNGGGNAIDHGKVLEPSLAHKRKLLFLLDCIGDDETFKTRAPVWQKLKHKVNNPVSDSVESAVDILKKYDSLEEAVISAIETENIGNVELLLDYRNDLVNVGDICDEEYHSPPHRENFIPLLLAAQGRNFEILKMFIMKGYHKIEEPHEFQCKCKICEDDPLLASRCRIETFKALASPLWIALTSRNPFINAFTLSDKLSHLVVREDEFENQFQELSTQCKMFALAMLDQCKSSEEQYVVLNHSRLRDKNNETITDRLELVKLAMEYDQKEFVAHSVCQHHITRAVFHNIPGWRTSGIPFRITYCLFQAIIFPILAVLYILVPHLSVCQGMRRPLVKFITHTVSFIIFLSLLTVSSMQKINVRFGEPPSIVEIITLLFVLGLTWNEIKQLWNEGAYKYFSSGWNWMDMGMIGSLMGAYSTYIVLYIGGWNKGKTDIRYITSMADGFYCGGVVMSFFRLVYLCQISRYLGLLQLCLGRMVRVILQFAFISCLVLLSFSVGMTTLYKFSRSHDEFVGKTDEAKNGNFFDGGYQQLYFTGLTLAWASLNMADLETLKTFNDDSLIYLWGAFFFTVYHASSMVVLLNMLIAMMSNSYQHVENNIETEYKFARTQMWMEYVDDESSLPPPFNIIPSIKSICRLFGRLTKKCFGQPKILPCTKYSRRSIYRPRRDCSLKEREDDYQRVVENLLQRYLVKYYRDLAVPWQKDETIVTISKVIQDLITEIRGSVVSKPQYQQHLNGITTIELKITFIE